MPALKNPRHEIAAQLRAKGMTEVDAHEQAGFIRNDGNANKLFTRQEVQDRVRELTGMSAARATVTIEGLIGEAAEIQRAAQAANQHSAAVAALTAKAKLSGLWIEKTDNRNRNIDDLNDAQLLARIDDLTSLLRANAENAATAGVIDVAEREETPPRPN